MDSFGQKKKKVLCGLTRHLDSPQDYRPEWILKMEWRLKSQHIKMAGKVLVYS